MPLARITAPLAEFYDRLAQDLRARGFDVQKAHSGQFFPEAADLEITVRRCAPEDAARFAADASAHKDMCVLVNPGGRQGSVHSIEMIVVEPPAVGETASAGVTPAQVIEISSLLARSVEPGSANPAPLTVVQPTALIRARRSAHSTWRDISKTTTLWMRSVSAGCRNGWLSVKQSTMPVRGFFWEVSDETKALYQRALGAIRGAKSVKKLRDDEDQLVPSMFHLSEPDSVSESSNPEVIEHQVVVQMPERGPQKRVAGDARLLKATSAAGMAAVAVLLAVSVMHRAPAPGAATNPHASDAKAVTPASATIKPSAMIEHGGERRAAGVQMVSARQVPSDESSVNDTVVRYGRRAPSPRPRSNPYEIKHYSDLD